ncbi:MAG: hypothetical protein ACLRFE_03465 [Clostridia bacterium]
MSIFNTDNRLIRNRINENLLKVKNESPKVKSLLSLSVQSSSINNCEYTNSILGDINLASRTTTRTDLLRTVIILATSRNTIAQENLMEVLRIRIGKINDKDYKFIANLISLKNPHIVDKVNNFLCRNLNGYADLHNKYFYKYYGI